MKFSKRGFTLIEIIVAISVITVGIVGIYALVPRIVLITSSNTDRFIASQLAREGIEIVRNIRDSNWLAGNPWNNGLTGCLESEGGCALDYDDTSLSKYQARYLYIDDADGFYKYLSSPSAGDKKTKFKRKIIITPDTDRLNVAVQVFWGNNTFSLQENLYNWY